MPSAAELRGKYVGFKLDQGGATADQQKQLARGELVMIGPTAPCSVKVYTSAGDAGPFAAAPVPWSRYTEQHQERLAHVGTAHEPTDPGTIAVKNAWKAMAARVTGIGGAAPFPDVIKPGDVQKAMGKGGIPQVVGYFAAGSAYAMILAPVGNTAVGYITKIAEVREMKLAPWSNVANLRQFA